MTTLPLADLAQALEQAIKPGYSLTRTKRNWYLKRWDSGWRNDQLRMGWFDVDSDHSLSALLGRLEKP